MRELGAVLILAAAGLAACSREAPAPAPAPNPTPVELAAVVAALEEADGEALRPWLRDTHALRVRTRCPSCPPDRRVTVRSLSGEQAEAFAAGLVAPSLAPSDAAHPAPLQRGKASCAGRCCDFATGMLDHATYHLARLCFARDESGLISTEIEVVDGG